MEPGLYIVGTPIGNLEDITFRAVEVLKQSDVIMAEDTRHSKKLMVRYDVKTPMKSCHSFSEASRVDQVLDSIRGGLAVCLVSDSGMPAISDPGARLIQACHSADLPVILIPGPSAVPSALALSGAGGDRFRFEGFLPRKSGQRQRRLDAIREETVPVVLFESPRRLVRLLGEIEDIMGPQPIFVAREMTKRFEEGRWDTPEAWRKHFEGRTVKGELTLVLSPDGGGGNHQRQHDVDPVREE